MAIVIALIVLESLRWSYVLVASLVRHPRLLLYVVGIKISHAWVLAKVFGCRVSFFPAVFVVDWSFRFLMMKRGWFCLDSRCHVLFDRAVLGIDLH